MNKKYLKKVFYKKCPIDEGFTFLEFIFVISLLGITSSIVVPLFNSSLNKSRQKEANLIVSSLIKSAKANYAINGNLPNNMGQLSKFARYQKCNQEGVEIQGRLVCKEKKKFLVERNDFSFFSPSGNYKIDIDNSYADYQNPMFLVKANPNGNTFKTEGSAVVGCYNSNTGLTLIKTYSGKPDEKGEKPFLTCNPQLLAKVLPIDDDGKKKLPIDDDDDKKKLPIDDDDDKKKIPIDDKKKLPADDDDDKKKIPADDKKKLPIDDDDDKKKMPIDDKKKLPIRPNPPTVKKENKNNKTNTNNGKNKLSKVGNINSISNEEESTVSKLAAEELIGKTFRKFDSQKSLSNINNDFDKDEIIEDKNNVMDDPIPPWIK